MSPPSLLRDGSVSGADAATRKLSGIAADGRPVWHDRTVDAATGTERRPGQPSSERDAAFLKRFDAVMQVPIIVSAILPLLVAPESNGWVGVVIGIVTWLVFLVDYVSPRPTGTHRGKQPGPAPGQPPAAAWWPGTLTSS
jgi:hypothetical protein